MTPKQKAMEIINRNNIEFEIHKAGHGSYKKWSELEIFYPEGMMSENEGQSTRYQPSQNISMWEKAMETLTLIDEWLNEQEKEDQAMVKEYADDYRKYLARNKKLIRAEINSFSGGHEVLISSDGSQWNAIVTNETPENVALIVAGFIQAGYKFEPEKE